MHVGSRGTRSRLTITVDVRWPDASHWPRTGGRRWSLGPPARKPMVTLSAASGSRARSDWRVTSAALAEAVAAFDARNDGETHDVQGVVTARPRTVRSSPTPTPRSRAAFRPRTISSMATGASPSRTRRPSSPAHRLHAGDVEGRRPRVTRMLPMRVSAVTSGSSSRVVTTSSLISPPPCPTPASKVEPTAPDRRASRPGWPRRSLRRRGRRRRTAGRPPGVLMAPASPGCRPKAKRRPIAAFGRAIFGASPSTTDEGGGGARRSLPPPR